MSRFNEGAGTCPPGPIPPSGIGAALPRFNEGAGTCPPGLGEVGDGEGVVDHASMRGRARARPDLRSKPNASSISLGFNEGAGTCPPGLPS